MIHFKSYSLLIVTSVASRGRAQDSPTLPHPVPSRPVKNNTVLRITNACISLVTDFLCPVPFFVCLFVCFFFEAEVDFFPNRPLRTVCTYEVTCAESGGSKGNERGLLDNMQKTTELNRAPGLNRVREKCRNKFISFWWNQDNLIYRRNGLLVMELKKDIGSLRRIFSHGKFSS